MTDTVVTRASQALLGTKQQATSSPSSSRSLNNTSVNMYMLDKAFYRILETYGMPDEPVTFHTILFYLRAYIVSRELFDPSRRDVILCNGDPLGSLFKRISFTTSEAADLIKRHISPVFTQKLHNVGQIKSNVSNSDIKVLEGVSDDDKINTSSSDDDDLDANSELSLEIAFEQIGSDDSQGSLFEDYRDKNNSKSFVASDCSLDSDIEEFEAASISSLQTEYNEFEPFSEQDSDDDQHSFSSGSDLEIHILEEQITVERIGSTDDDDFFADSSDSDNSSSRDGASVSNPWFCKCLSDESKAKNGFCHNCWTARFGWRKEEERRVPPRMARRKRKCPGRNDLVDHLPAKMLKPDSTEVCERQLASSPVTENEEPFSQGQSSTASTDDGSLDFSGTCMMCESRPRNSAIVHGRSAHIVGCYKCSRKIQEKKLKCPQCRRMVERVVRLFV